MISPSICWFAGTRTFFRYTSVFRKIYRLNSLRRIAQYSRGEFWPSEFGHKNRQRKYYRDDQHQRRSKRFIIVEKSIQFWNMFCLFATTVTFHNLHFPNKYSEVKIFSQSHRSLTSKLIRYPWFEVCVALWKIYVDLCCIVNCWTAERKQFSSLFDKLTWL